MIVNVGRAGAANLDVIQEVEYVKQEAKMLYLLECLQKTAPPVLIFCESKSDVDEIHEYLLIKGVAAVGMPPAASREGRPRGPERTRDTDRCRHPRRQRPGGAPARNQHVPHRKE